MKQVAKLFRIKQVKATAFHQQTNGSLERYHSSLKSYLKVFAIKNKDDWHEYVELATFNFNTTVGEATWHHPFELVFGRRPRFPSSEPCEINKLLTYGEFLKKSSDLLILLTISCARKFN